MTLPYIPSRVFNGEEGAASTGNAGPVGIKADTDEINAMFDPDATHGDGTKGGIAVGNMATGEATATPTAGKIVLYDGDGNVPGTMAAAVNVTTNINGHPISDIFESNGTTAKLATVAARAKGIPFVSGEGGGIIMWSGSVASIANIPAEYGTFHLCDGTNGTPDMRDKFIVGAGHDYAVGATGGEATHTLTAAEIPAHTHTLQSGPSWGNNSGTGMVLYDSRYENIRNDLTTNLSGGSGGAHENRPPYYALCYIMRIA